MYHTARLKNVGGNFARRSVRCTRPLWGNTFVNAQGLSLQPRNGFIKVSCASFNTGPENHNISAQYKTEVRKKMVMGRERRWEDRMGHGWRTRNTSYKVSCDVKVRLTRVVFKSQICCMPATEIVRRWNWPKMCSWKIGAHPGKF